jgi:hypothetical protein
LHGADWGGKKMKKNLKKSGGKIWWSGNYFVSL